jgi:DNA polymerase I-like protein with 3'-5' exonuclease and polymerase domains
MMIRVKAHIIINVKAMIGRILYIANLQSPEGGKSENIMEYSHEIPIREGNWSAFVSWFDQQSSYQFDIETDVTDWWDTKRLISLQFGSTGGENRTQWFIQWSALSFDRQNDLRDMLRDASKLKLIHNAAFEYIVMRFHGVILENVYDTMLAEKVLRGGLENENYALADISYRYLRIVMNKELQKSFGDDIITYDKILYGINDVAWLDIIKRQQIEEGAQKNLLNVFALEMENILALSDMTYEGMLLDKEKWRENERLARPVVEEALNKLNSWLLTDELRDFAVAKGYISDQDRVMINLNSHQQKAELLQLIFPDLEGASLGIIKKYQRDHLITIEPEHHDILEGLLHKDYEPMLRYLLRHHKDYLIDKEYVIPALQSTINWGSWQQVLPLFQVLLPKIKGTGEEERNKFSHPILKDFERYGSASKLITDLGEEFINKYVGPDGHVRTNWNPVVSTGRVSSSRPNMQNITVDESVGTRYRNAFICEPGWVFVDSDYVSQELVIIAYVSKDPVWMEAIEKGWDLHSICAELVYKSKWKEAAETGCVYYDTMYYSRATKSWIHPSVYNDCLIKGEDMSHWIKIGPKQKCNCKKHKTLRNNVKTINFGLAYGMSEIKLSGTVGITVGEALRLIKDYFSAFPLIGRTLDFLGEFGLRNGYIMTLAPFYRKRWFPHWEAWRGYIDAHIQGIRHVKDLGKIERESKNHPIQGSSADIVKTAMILVRWYIRDNNLWDKVRLKMNVHDQITTIARQEYAEEWRDIFDNIMREAAKIVIPTGILKADTQITPYWTK